MSSPREGHGAKPDTLHTIPDVAEFLRVTERTVRNYIGRGQLQAIRLGRLIRVRRKRPGAVSNGPTDAARWSQKIPQN